jgi:hypothetical protein
MKRVWGVWAVRSSASVFGAAASWAKQDGKVFRGTQEEAERLAEEWNKQSSSGNVRYYPKEVDDNEPS